MQSKLSDIIECNDDSNNTDDEANNLRKDRYKQKTKQQKHWSIFIMCFISCWSIFDFVMMILYGYNVLKLNDAIIITLITTTLAQIIALPIIICKYLFPQEIDK